MDNAPRGAFISGTFVIGFGLGIFLGAMLGLLAVLIALPEDKTPELVEVPVYVTGTPLPRGEDPPNVRANAALAVRVGPGESFATLGTLSRGDQVDVVGRDFESKWLAIRFPLGSNSRGWIPAASVDGLAESNVKTLAVLLPTPLPFVFNTPSPFFGAGGGTGSNGGGPGGTPTPIPTTSDLDIQSVRVLADGRVSVIVVNRGPAPITNQIVQVTVRALGLAGETMVHTGLFPSGESITFRTESFRVTSQAEVQAIVDPGANINDPSRANNVKTQTLSPQPTAEPPASPTPGFG
jgi:uncharacterized protein YgiM (DUF1202 family)